MAVGEASHPTPTAPITDEPAAAGAEHKEPAEAENALSKSQKKQLKKKATPKTKCEKVNIILLILDGNSVHGAHAWKKKVFFEKGSDSWLLSTLSNALN